MRDLALGIATEVRERQRFSLYRSQRGHPFPYPLHIKSLLYAIPHLVDLAVASFNDFKPQSLQRAEALCRDLTDPRCLAWTALARAPDAAVATTAAGAWAALVGFLVGGITQYTFGDNEVALMMWVTVAILMRLVPTRDPAPA